MWLCSLARQFKLSIDTSMARTSCSQPFMALAYLCFQHNSSDNDIDQIYTPESWVNFYGNIGKTLLSLVSIFFDIVFIIQHYMLYPAKKRALPTSQSEIKDTTEFDSKAAAQF
ncbi:hypothetical protein KSS87_007480 [Heliosperma pusillum]|nr:hypothetical protein KSS87_007480 [Heliosperma pusillum]